ncbi:MAG: twin-arginine translocation signal domain-containing protein, partial [Bacteroidales bacterium]|nr:twin-arginine translocation signal domain-containing protein [Bacteroidales bacterium]
MLRRNFIKTSALAGVAGISGAYSQAMPTSRITPQKITIQTVNSNFEREPLIRPFGFKGIYQKEF